MAEDFRRGKVIAGATMDGPVNQVGTIDLGVSVCITTDETLLLSPLVGFNHWTPELMTSDFSMDHRSRQQDPRN